MKIEWTNFETHKLPKRFEQKRINLDFSESFLDKKWEIRRNILENTTVWEILRISKIEDRFQKLKELVWKIDNLINSWKSISYNTDFRLFKEIFNNLDDDSKKNFNSKYSTQTWNIFKDYQKYYLRERILSNLRMDKPNNSLLWQYIFDYKKLEEKVDLSFILDIITSDSERRELLNYF